MTTLLAALETASEHWQGRKGAATMEAGVRACTGALEALYGPLELCDLNASYGVFLLSALRAKGLSAKSVAVYYGAFRRGLDLAQFPTPSWPKAPTPPRKTRDPFKAEPLEALRMWLYAQGWPDTADLLTFMRGTGLRVNVEARTAENLRLEPQKAGDWDILHVVGKGANERIIPVVRLDTRALLRDEGRMLALRERPYRTHLWRWTQGVKALGITSRLATPHAVRHGYATEAYEKSGGNLALVQELLGHASVTTTSTYVTVDMDKKAGALSA